MDKSINIYELISIYMIENGTLTIGFNELQNFTTYIKDCYAKNKQDIKISYSDFDLREIRYGQNEHFMANLSVIGARHNHQSLMDRFVYNIDEEIYLSTSAYTQNYLEKKDQAEISAHPSKAEDKEMVI